MKYDYDVIVIGGGAAGLVAATGTAGLGAKTALLEKRKLGGDCTWYGCVPSKALIRSAKVFQLFRRSKEFGISAGPALEFRPGHVMAHVRDMAKQISARHPPEVFEKRGIRVIFGSPRFIDDHVVELDGRRVSAKRFIISTGTYPLVPEIEGLKSSGYLTNENIFDLDVLPGSIAILGAGAVGVELAQAFSRLGVEVSLIEAMDRILIREDRECSDELSGILTNEGVKLYTGKKAIRLSREGGLTAITLEDKDKKESSIKAQRVLVSVGRAANVNGLGLEQAGVEYSAKGITVDQTLKTTAKNIYACGDVAGPYPFSHMAEYQAIICAANCLFPVKQKVNYAAVAWCTFTDPELAHLGYTEDEARARYKGIRIFKSFYSANDRAVTDREEKGFAKVICDKNGRILGAHILGENSGESIHEYVLAKSAGKGIGSLSSLIHVYPTLSQVVKRTADQYYFEIMASKWFKVLARFLSGFTR